MKTETAASGGQQRLSQEKAVKAVVGRAPSPPAPKRPGCQGRKKDGDRCDATPNAAGFCPWHDPERSPEEKLAWAVRGGLTSRPTVLPSTSPTPPLDSPQQVSELLRETVGQVRRGEIAPAVANAVGYLCGVALRSFELDLARRLGALEQIARERKTPMVVRIDEP
jgi:hypothetical protein